MTDYPYRRVIVASAPVVALANQLAQVADPDGWQNEWTAPLRAAGDPTNMTVGYWCCWTMSEQQRLALDGALASASVTPAATDAEKQVYAPGDTLPALSTSQRIVICDADEATGFTPNQVLAELGLDRLETSL